MIGIITAAGKGIRIKDEYKSLLMVNGKYIIENIFENMKNVGIKEIYVIVSGTKIEETCGYEYYGLKINYIQQPKQDGLNEAIKLCRHLSEPMLVILGDIIYEGDDLKEMIECFEEGFKKHNFLASVAFKKENYYKEIQKSFGFTKKWPMQIIEKPKKEDEKILRESLGLGIFIITPQVIDLIGKEPYTHFTETFNKIPCETIIHELKGKYFNVNTQEELANANNNSI